MTQTVTRSLVVHRDFDAVSDFVTEPARVLGAMPGLGRFKEATDSAGPDGCPEAEEWDVFLVIGTLHVGGRVCVTRPSPHRLEWHSLRGTVHSFRSDVESVEGGSRITMSLTYTLAGFLTGRAAELVARGIVARQLDAGLEQVRHYLEHEDPAIR